MPNGRYFILLVGMVASLQLRGSAIPCHASSPVHGTRSVGMETTFVGLADDPSAIAINHVELSWCSGTYIYTGVTAVSPASTYQNPADAEGKSLDRNMCLNLENEITATPDAVGHVFVLGGGISTDRCRSI